VAADIPAHPNLVHSHSILASTLNSTIPQTIHDAKTETRAIPCLSASRLPQPDCFATSRTTPCIRAPSSCSKRDPALYRVPSHAADPQNQVETPRDLAAHAQFIRKRLENPRKRVLQWRSVYVGTPAASGTPQMGKFGKQRPRNSFREYCRRSELLALAKRHDMILPCHQF